MDTLIQVLEGPDGRAQHGAGSFVVGGSSFEDVEQAHILNKKSPKPQTLNPKPFEDVEQAHIPKQRPGDSDFT